MDAATQRIYLQRTLDLAISGEGKVFKGPLLGWVVVKNRQIVGEGEQTVSPLFISDGQDKALLKNSALFLNVNPFADINKLSSLCSEHGISTCYIATDPDSPVRQAALDLNCRYFTWLYEKRPYLILKWAETADGFMARSDYRPYWISNAHSRKLVHQWRSQEAAIWAGKNTYQCDNPRLNVRDWEGSDPIRIVIDPQLQLSNQLHVFDQSQRTLCYNSLKNETYQNLEFIRLSGDALSWKGWVRAMFDDLHQRQIQSVLIEGGATLLSFLIENGWWDEARVFRAPTTFEKGISAPAISTDYYYVRQRISGDTLTVYRKNQFLKTKQKIKE